MILYLDASALVKEYLAHEPGAEELALIRRDSDLIGTSTISRAETSAALARAVRTKVLTLDEATSALRQFRSSWPDLVRLQVTESLMTRADALAWEEGLRGFDAVHLASAITWREGLGDDVIFAAFDVSLWEAAGRLHFARFPGDLPAMLSQWKKSR